MDPIANLLNSIKNAYQNQFSKLKVPHSKMKMAVCQVLQKGGVILDCKKIDGEIIITLNPDSSFVQFRQVSKPGARIYIKSSKLPRPKTPTGVVVVSTSRGVMSDKMARQQGLGGEVICEIN